MQMKEIRNQLEAFLEVDDYNVRSDQMYKSRIM